MDRSRTVPAVPDAAFPTMLATGERHPLPTCQGTGCSWSNLRRAPVLARAESTVRAPRCAEAGDTFAVLTAGTRLRAYGSSRALTVTPDNVRTAIDFLERAHLVGALHLSRALEEAEPYVRAGANAHLVHVGSGRAGMGEREATKLAALIPSSARYIGIAVGRQWSRTFMQAAAARTGGMVATVAPGDPIRWRVLDLMSALNGPRLQQLKLSAEGSVRFLMAEQALSLGELCVLPAGCGRKCERVVVHDQLDNKPWGDSCRWVRVAQAGYLPRTGTPRNQPADDQDPIRIATSCRTSKESYVISPRIATRAGERQMYEYSRSIVVARTTGRSAPAPTG